MVLSRQPFYTVKSVSDFAGISIRALHHYDEFGLFKPSSVSPSGYRLYSDADLKRLQEILFFRELGFALKEIKNILDSPDYDREQALHSHRIMLLGKKKRIEGLIDLVNNTLATKEVVIGMKNEEMFDGFDDTKIEDYKREAREKWGNTNVYKESELRTSKYSKADWDEIKVKSNDIFNSLAILMEEGRKPADSGVQEQIDRWFTLINEKYYACTPEVFRSLADMYVTDKRFMKTYDSIRPGLAEFKRVAMHVYCNNLQAKEM